MYCMSTIKVAKTFRLSAEAVSILESQSNATQFIEDLITGLGSPAAESKAGLSKEEVLDLIKAYLPMGPSVPNNSTTLVPNSIPGLTTGAAFVPKPPDPDKGYPCCSGRTPCKHWIWDDMHTEWKNSLTGKTREA